MNVKQSGAKQFGMVEGHACSLTALMPASQYRVMNSAEVHCTLQAPVRFDTALTWCACTESESSALAAVA